MQLTKTLLTNALILAGVVQLSANAQPIGYSVQSNGDDHLYAIDLQTGVATDLGLITFGDAEGLTFGQGGQLYAIGGTDAQFWNITTPPGTLVGATGPRNGVDAGLDYDSANGVMYNSQGGTGSDLYTIDIATGAATHVGSGTDFVDNLSIRGGIGYGSDWIFNDSLYSVDLATGATSLIGSLGQGDVSDQAGGAFALDGTLYNLLGDGRIFTLDIATGAATFVAQTTIGGVAASGFEGLAIADIPEPSTVILAALALFAISFQRRRSAAVCAKI